MQKHVRPPISPAQLPYNRGMTQLDLLLPFALAPQEMARDLLRELNMPSLAMLLSRGKPQSVQSEDEFSRALPHENWLAHRFGLQAALDNSSPMLAANMLRTFGLPVQSGWWFILQPAHLHVARDHLVLTDPRHLNLTEQESRDLFNTIKPLFDESGKTLHFGSAAVWLLRADDWQTLRTSTPDAACGHNIDIWMPHGEQARDWRRLQNEIQMHWHAHAVNDAREMRGLKPVNSVWLWGGAAAGARTAQQESKQTFIPGEPHNPFAPEAILPISTIDILDSVSQRGLLILDDLVSPALATDWAEWLAHFQPMESTWFAPLLDALQSGRLERLSITLSHGTTLATYAINRTSLRKFWRAPSLARLSA